MDLELRHLKAIRAIHDAGSLTKAATALGLAQPALSAQLKRIERTLGGPLFERGRQGVQATALGELVLQRARIVLPAVHGLQQEAAQFARSAGDGWRALRIGAGYGEPLGGLVDRLAALRPGVRIATRTSWSEEDLAASVADGRLDFALIGTCGSGTPPAADQISWQPVAADPVRLMVAVGGPLDHPGPLDLAALDGWAWTAVPGDGCLADCFTAACARAGAVAGSLYETDAASCAHLARVGRAVGLCRATFPGAPGVATRELSGNPLTWRHLLGHRPGGATAAIAPVVLELAGAAYAEALRAVRPDAAALS
ncbi:LysR family transcriptional regulator [Streptomyces boninensis]|uniref:LysR family transcriptional regulator n=1 Tax=Streptomyces boninensis TaxID=2039455 RepID=UPI003B21EA28